MVLLKDDIKLSLARFSDLQEQALKKKTPRFSQFLDPAEINLLHSHFKTSPFCNLLLFGGFDDAERKIAGFFPDFCEQTKESFPLSVIEITGAKDASHRDFLGSILALGIKRNMIGDIVLKDGVCYIFALNSICDFFLSELKKVGRQNVKMNILSYSDVHFEPKEFNESFITVASLRLDGVISAALHISRAKAQELIKKELANLNWQPATNSSKNVAEGDFISVRKYGRFKIGEILGETKKGRIKIIIQTDK